MVLAAQAHQLPLGHRAASHQDINANSGDAGACFLPPHSPLLLFLSHKNTKEKTRNQQDDFAGNKQARNIQQMKDGDRYGW